MIKITKDEKNYLLSQGCKWHEDITASTTRRHYYAVESFKVKDLLLKYKQNTLISTLSPSEP